MVTTNEDCLWLGCDWSDWWIEYCRAGHPHTMRVCGRCECVDEDSCQQAALATVDGGYDVVLSEFCCEDYSCSDCWSG